MRRGSLVGPVLLILIGLLFLVNNLRPDLPLLDVVARYWPYLLIAWGLLRMLEILVAAMRSRPLPLTGISGGEWVLVVFLCLIGSALYFANRYSSRWPQARITMHGIEVFGESFDYPLEATRPAGKAPRLLVENLRGNARIVASDTEEVKVGGRTTIRAFHQSDADKAFKECPLEIVTQGGLVVVRTNHDRLSGPQRISSDLDIAVPRGASIQGRGRYGDFDITGVTGDVEVSSENAGVRLQDIGGGVRIDLRRSDIIRCVGLKGTVDLKGRGQDVELENVEGQVTINGSYSGEMLFRNLAKPLRLESSVTEFEVQRIPGQVRMALGSVTASDLVGPILLKTRSRDVRFSEFTESLEISVDRGDIELRPGRLPLAKMDVRTRSGAIELTAPAAAKFGLAARTERGEAINEFGPAIRVETEGRGARMTGPEGQQPVLTLVTDRGSVTIRKTSVLPPSPKSSSPTVSLPVERQ